MRIRCVIRASVSSALLAACVAASGPAFAASNNPDILVAQQAYQLLASGDPFAAIESYSTAIESRKLPTEILANALLNRALAHQQLSQHQDAIDDYTAALQLDAMTAQLRATALYNRGLSQQKINKQSAAIEDFTSALFLDPAFAHAYYSRGNALQESGQFLFALSDYDKALRNNHPDAARVHYATALTYESLKRPADAQKSLELALAINPGFQQASQKLAMLQGNPVAPSAKDPILADASGAFGGKLVVRKPDLPQAVAPTEALMADDTAADPIATAAVDTHVLPAVAKIPDRLPMARAKPAVAEERIVAVETVDEPVQTAAVDAESASTETTATIAPTGWGVQVTSATTEDAAWSTWKKMQAKHRVLKSQTPIVVKADLGAKGVFYRVRLSGFENQNAAKSTCSKLKAGGVSCFVSKMSS